MRISITEAGGLAPVVVRTSADSAELSEHHADQLTEKVRRAELFEATFRPPDSTPDAIAYELDVDDGSRRRKVRLGEAGLSGPVRELVEWVKSLPERGEEIAPIGTPMAMPGEGEPASGQPLLGEDSMSELSPGDVVQSEPSPEALEGAIELEPNEVLRLQGLIDDIDLAPEGIAVGAAGALALALGQHRQGVAESPPGSNRGVPLSRYVHWFAPNAGPLPWCAFFLSWCLDRSTDANRRVQWANPGYVGSISAWARSAGRLVNAPRPGDVFGHGDDHCGFVQTVEGSHITTVEGNYSDRVAVVRRPKAGLWFARIA